MANSLGTSVTTKKLEMKPVPLLVVMISFEPDGDDGRQICSTTKEYWYEQFFGDNGLTLKNYYKEMSGGKFYFSPVDVNGSDVKGVIHVTLHCKHPDLLQQENPDKRTGAALYVVAEALKACEPYVDFAALDKDGDGFLSADELHYVLVHAGFDYSGGKETTPELRYGVFANSGRLPDEEDAQGFPGAHSPRVGGVKLCAASKGSYTLIGEYRKTQYGFLPHPLGTTAHELGHAIGFHDIYDYDRQVKGWPLPMMFSVMCNGCYGLIRPKDKSERMPIMGTCPTHLDPLQKIRSGFTEAQLAEGDGEYSLYSILSGKYNILRINTPDPAEYFLLENRQIEGFDSGLYRRRVIKSDDGKVHYEIENYERGGMLVWHIDKDIFDEFSGIKRTNGSGLWNGDGETQRETRHNPGVVIDYKNGYDENGLMKDDGVFLQGFPDDPFYRAGETFNSNEFISAATHTKSLNSFPDGIDENKYNLKIEVLEDTGSELKIRVSQTY